jgi:hypothetical protein
MILTQNKLKHLQKRLYQTQKNMSLQLQRFGAKIHFFVTPDFSLEDLGQALGQISKAEDDISKFEGLGFDGLDSLFQQNNSLLT